MNVQQAAEKAIAKTKENLDFFKETFPAAQSENYVYPRVEGYEDWTEGFYPGILWLCYELSKDNAFAQSAREHDRILIRRARERRGVEHHDMGFLYSLSCVAEYKLIGSEEAKEGALLAAGYLMERFQEKGAFIQAWGELGAPDNYRLIIDCLLNVPLLYWATEVTGDPKYREAALKHVRTTMKVIVREDGTTYHTYYFDPETGAPLKGVTHQGYSDDSCWARGQAWGVYGLTLSYLHTRDDSILALWKKVTDCFISGLPQDKVPYWDMIFKDGSGEPRDTSAAAIAICGILEMSRHFDIPEYVTAADEMLQSLMDHYTTERLEKSNGLLTDAMYSRPGGHQPECNIWGDYFYMEALMRKLRPDWKMYW